VTSRRSIIFITVEPTLQGHRGTNYGINFSSTSLGSIDRDAGGTGNFANEPSANTIVAFLVGSAATMNVAAGFDTGFSFFYSSKENGFVNVYDGTERHGQPARIP
jgi:hypothetical protein